MRKPLTLGAVALAVTLMTAPLAGQVAANDAYQVGYTTNAFLKIINTGQTGSPISKDQGTICADIYIFDANQEMSTCCACKLTANEMIAVIGGQPLTGVLPLPGVVKVVADAGCDATTVSAPVEGGLRSFLTNFTPPNPTETILQPAPLTIQEQQFLGNACAFVHYLGSGRGVCQCRPGGFVPLFE